MQKEIYENLSDIELEAFELENYIKILKNSIEQENSIDYLWNFVNHILEKSKQHSEQIEKLRINIGNYLIT